jgi:uncharacterized protein (TIGR00661 family)
MKILIAIQKTGNGHLARAQEVIPIIQKYAEVEILTSGTQGQIEIPFEVSYNKKGLSLFYNKNGGVSIFRTFWNNSFIRFIFDVLTFNTKQYDLIINDFEPITAWSSLLFGGNCISLSHQAALWYPETPKPPKTNIIANAVIRYYAPANQYYGFHFKSYNKRIFPSVIRKKIKNLEPKNGKHYVIYLPGYSNELITNVLNDFNEKWVVFSPRAHEKQTIGNCKIYAINEKQFFKSLATCKGVICGAGFELPSEVLYLKKKLLVIPLKNQLEQHYNAQALLQLGVTVSPELNKETIQNFLENETAISIDFDYDLSYTLRVIIAENTGDLRAIVNQS